MGPRRSTMGSPLSALLIDCAGPVLRVSTRGGRFWPLRSPTEDTGYQHLALVGGMAGWHCVGPLRGLLLNPVTLRDESRRWEDDAAARGGGARQHATEVQAQPVAGSRTAKWPNASGRKLTIPPRRDAAGGGGGARQQGSRSHVRDEKLFCSPSKRSIPRDRHHQGPFGSPLPRWCMCQRGA